MPKNNTDYNVFLNKAMAYCSKYERCSFDVRQKLISWQCPEDLLTEIIENLKSEQFIDNLRFAKAYTADKWRFNKWGKTKIAMYLRSKNIADEIVEESFLGIPNDEYRNMIAHELEKKWGSLSNATEYLKRKNKLFQFAASRGYSADFVYNWFDSNTAE